MSEDFAEFVKSIQLALHSSDLQNLAHVVTDTDIVAMDLNARTATIAGVTLKNRVFHIKVEW